MNLANQKEGINLRMHLEKLPNFKPHNKYLLSAYYVHKIEEDNMGQINYSYYCYERTILKRLI